MILENKVALGQVLFAGGSGLVGRAALKWFRERHPSVRVLVGGRNLQAAGEVAQQVGAVEAVAIDIDKPHWWSSFTIYWFSFGNFGLPIVPTADPGKQNSNGSA